MAELFAGKEWQTFLQILPTIPFETWETVWSTVVATLLALVIGLPLGVCLVTGEQGGVRPLPRWLMALLNGLVNLLRSVPFLILMIIVIPPVPRHRGHVHRYGGVHCAAGHRIVPVCVASGRDQYARGGRGCH